MCVTAPRSEGLTKTVGIMVFSYLRITKKKKKKGLPNNFLNDGFSND